MDNQSSKLDSIALFVLALIALVGLVAPAALLIWYGTSSNTVIRKADLGRFVGAATTPGGLFAPALSTIRTTVGSVTVLGAFSALRDSPLAIEYMSKSGLRLCVAGTRGHCVPLAGEWSGELQATPAAGNAFDFYGHGLTGGALMGWLMIGFFLCFCTMIVWGMNAERARGAGGGEQIEKT